MSPLAAFRQPGRERSLLFRPVLALAVAALMLCIVAILNGGPIYYNDTTAYLIDADRLFHLRAPYAVRPVLYGLLVWLCSGIWPIPWAVGLAVALFLQAMLVAHLIALTLRAVGAALRPAGFLLLTAALILVTPVSFHISHLLPDIFIAVMVLALFLLAFCGDTLRRGEIVYLFLLAAGAASLHLSALPVGGSIVGLAILLALLGQRWSRPALVMGPLVLAVSVLLAFSVLVFQRVTLEPNGPPHLLARVLADGPGVDYLRATCPGSGYALCRYLDRFPLTEDGFMWGMMSSVPTADGYKIKAEQSQVVRGTLAMFPAEMAWHALNNALRQMVTFRAETQVTPAQWSAFLTGDNPWSTAFSATKQARGALEGHALDDINAVQAGVTLASLLVALASLPRLLCGGSTRPATLIATTLVVLLTNGAFCGALGGVFARYQGRLIWLLPLAAIVAVICITRQPRKVDAASIATAG